MVQRAMNDTEADTYMEEEDGTNAENGEDTPAAPRDGE
jgi:hypothetical protein